MALVHRVGLAIQTVESPRRNTRAPESSGEAQRMRSARNAGRACFCLAAFAPVAVNHSLTFARPLIGKWRVADHKGELRDPHSDGLETARLQLLTE